MGANIAGIYGAQIFRQDDRPRYRRAFSIACAVLAFGLALAIFRYIDDVIRRRRQKNRMSDNPGSDTASQDEKEVDTPPPSDDQPGPIVVGDGLKPVVSHGLKATT